MQYKDIQRRDERIRELAQSGLKMAEIGRIYGLSRERIRQILGAVNKSSLDKDVDKH